MYFEQHFQALKLCRSGHIFKLLIMPRLHLSVCTLVKAHVLFICCVGGTAERMRDGRKEGKREGSEGRGEFRPPHGAQQRGNSLKLWCYEHENIMNRAVQWNFGHDIIWRKVKSISISVLNHAVSILRTHYCHQVEA